MSKPTEGPWSYREDRLEVHSPDGFAICDVRTAGVADEEVKPNARLIALAPSFLAASQNLLDAIDRTCIGNPQVMDAYKELGELCRRAGE